MLPLQWSSKPPYKTPLDRSHHLASRLVAFWTLAEGAGPAWDLVSGLMLAQGSGVRWGQALMPGLSCSSTTSQVQATAPPQLQISGPLTIAIGFRQVANPANTNAILGAVTFNSAFGTPFYAYGFQFNTSTTNVAFEINTAGGLRTITGGVVAAGGDYVLSASHISGSQLFYQNGLQVGSAANAGNPTYGTGPIVVIGSPASVNRNPNILAYWMAILSGVLTPAEQSAIGSSVTSIFRLLTPQKPIVKFPGKYTLAAGVGSYSLTGASASLLFGRKLTAAAGSYSLSGHAATLLATRNLVASAGSYSSTGHAAVLSRGFILTAAAGSYTLTGRPATLARTYVLTASAGSYVLTGQPTVGTLTYTSYVDPAAGTLLPTPDPTIQGVDPEAGTVIIQAYVKIVTIVTTYTLMGPSGGTVGQVSGTFTVALGLGQLDGPALITPSVTGAGGTFTPATVILTNSARSATFTFTPSTPGTAIIATTNDVGLNNPASISYDASSSGYTLIAGAGIYNLSGQAATLLAARNLVASAGSYVLSGQAAVLSYGSARTLLGPSDFTYLGSYQVDGNSLGAQLTFGQGLTHRYVSGQLRFLTFGYGGGNAIYPLFEFNLGSGGYGSTLNVSQRTNAWTSIWPGTTAIGSHVGLWWDEAKGGLWTTSSEDYPADGTPGSDFGTYRTSCIQFRNLNSDGTISNCVGPYGLANVGQRAIYGGIRAIPASMQAQCGGHPYLCGWGGYTSRMAQGLSPSMGLMAVGIPDVTGYTSPTAAIPTSDFKILADHRGGVAGSDWYNPASSNYNPSLVPTSIDRGQRSTNPTNYFDGGDPRSNPTTRPTVPPLTTANWLSPAPDGAGRWPWGDNYYGTGTWIDGPSKYGFLAVAAVGSGSVWYANSTLNYDSLDAEIHVFDPADFGLVVAGTKQPWQVQPASMKVITSDLAGQGLYYGKSGSGPLGNFSGATFDATTKILWLWATGVSAGYNCLLAAYSVNC